MAPFTPKPGFIFAPDPPKEVLDYLKERKLKPSFDYRDVWREEHVTGFTVAKATGLDMLSTFKEAVVRAEAEGIPLRQFSKELTPRLQELGWWGVKPMLDPKTGRTLPVHLGSPRRLKVIYRTNLAVAHSAGRWERLQRTKDVLPYGRYSLGPSVRHREQHLAWEGVILPLDDLFWGTHWPPNGWGCKCWVQTLTRAQTAEAGGPSKPPKIRKRRWKNKRTGKTEMVPVGIDPGWDYNPGQARMAHLGQALEEKEQGFTAAFGIPAPPRQLLWPAQSEPVFTTVPGVNREELERVMARIPGAEPQVAALARFLHTRGTKALFLKEAQISRGRSASAIADAVGRFLGPPWDRYPEGAYTVRGARRTLGFTSHVYNHVVVKAKAADRLADVDPGSIARAVERCVERHRAGRPAWSTTIAHEELTGGRQTRGVSTFVHELGHQVHFYAGFPPKPARLPSLTQYSTVNGKEWHAEHFAAWTLNREALNEWSPDVVQYFDNLIDRVLAH